LNDEAACTFKYVAKGEIPKGSAIRLGAVGKVMGAAEGIETALSASILSGKNGSERIPVWSTIDSGKMSSFDPPTGTETYIIFADNDTAGIEAAKSSERNSWAKETMVLTPPTRNQDWNDVLRGMRLNNKESGLERMNAVQEAMSKATAKITRLNKLELSL
jgi:putative DNA primase/helicase